MNHRIIRVAWCLLLAGSCVAPAPAQVRPTPEPTTPVELTIKAHYSDPRTTAPSVRVQLLNDLGMPVAESYLDGNSQSRFSVSPGNYRVRLSGMDVETLESSLFTVHYHSRVHYEQVSLRLRGEGTSRPPADPKPIAAAEMNIPKKAVKEFEKGVTAMDKGAGPEAEAHFRKAIAIYPDYGNAYNNLGVLALRGKDVVRGREYLLKAMALGSQGALANLSKLAIQENKISEAEEYLSKLVNVDPLNSEFLLTLARVEYQLGKKDAALLHARRVHNLPHKGQSACHVLIGTMLEEQGDEAGALEEFRVYIAESPDGQWAKQVREAIGTLEARVRQATARP